MEERDLLQLAIQNMTGCLMQFLICKQKRKLITKSSACRPRYNSTSSQRRSSKTPAVYFWKSTCEIYACALEYKGAQMGKTIKLT